MAGCWETDFYDGYHIRGEALQRVFPGMPGVEKQQRAGSAGSAWLFSQGPRVPYQTAEKIVVRINQIEPPEYLERGEDIDINGVSCYQLLRYRPGESTGGEEEPQPLLLASYAVSHNEGVFYRLDTNINSWVIDPRF